jgi:ribosomal protein S18 acetylase RimI-like enzyme
MPYKHGPVFDNIVWHTLCGPHARYANGTGQARRYAPGFSPFIAFADLGNANFDDLAPVVEAGEQMYCDGWAGAAPAGWRVESEAILVKMTWEGATPAADAAPEAVLLGPRHAGAALELAALTSPGPFSARTTELGDYFGVFDGGRLVAMAGARACVGGFREITGVCTHPDFQGRGLARRLALKLLWLQARRGETPFLRVMRDNGAVHDLYQRMGFRDYHESVARVVSRCGAA